MKIVTPIIALILLLATILFLEDERPRADVVWVHATDLFTLDPQKMSYQHDLRAAKAIYEPLAHFTPESEVVPAAAESWDISEDGRTYTFHLRDGIRFSNGDPVTANDFLYAWRRAILPDTAAKYSALFFNIKGARAFFEWRAATLGDGSNIPHEEVLATFQEMVSLRALDEKTLQVELEEPTPYFLDLCAFGTFSPVHAASVAAATSIEEGTGRIKEDPSWLKPGNLISNGPYVLERWRYKRDVRFERNPEYWNSEAVMNDSIEAIVIEDSNTALLAFQAGEADWLPNLGTDYRADMIEERVAYVQRYDSEITTAMADGATFEEALASLPPPEKGERRDVFAIPSFGTDYYQINCRENLPDGRPSPYVDPRVRRALAMAINKTAIVERVTRLREEVSGSMVPAGSIPGYTAPAGLPHDPERARQELAAAGWTVQDGVLANEAGEPFPTLIILYSTGLPRYSDISLAMRDMWRRELGMPVEVQGKPGNEYRAMLEAGNFMVARGGWYGDYGDPTTFLDLNRTGDGNNHRAFSNPEYDGLLKQAEIERDKEKRMQLLEEAERLLVEEQLPVIPLCTFVTIYMYEPGELEGLTHHPRLEQYPHRLKPRRQDG